VYLSSIFLGPMAADIYAVHQFLSNIDSKALWQRRGHKVLLLSERKLENSREVGVDFPKNTQLPFTLRIRPVYRSHDPESGKVIEKRLPADQMMQNLRNKASGAGFTFLDALASSEEPYALKKPGSTIQLYSMYIVGTLRVLNTPLFRSVLCHGMGRSKRFGFGMINVWE